MAEMYSDQEYDAAAAILHVGRVRVLDILSDSSKNVSAQLEDALMAIKEVHKAENRYWRQLDREAFKA